MLKNIVAYNAINKAIAYAATKTIMKHFWYLGDVLVGLVFFSDAKISAAEKVEMTATVKMLVKADQSW